MKFKELSELVRAADDYRRKYGVAEHTNKTAKNLYESTARDTLFANLALGYELIGQMHDPVNADVVADFLFRRNVAPAEGKTNPFYPLVCSIYGKHVDGVWKPNNSAKKYANVFRLAFQKGKKPEDFADWVKGFKDEPSKKRFLGGIEAQDRRENGPNRPAVEEALRRDINTVLAQPDLAELPKSTINWEAPNAKFQCVWGKLGKDGVFHIMGELPNMDNQVEKYLRRIASERAAKIKAPSATKSRPAPKSKAPAAEQVAA